MKKRAEEANLLNRKRAGAAVSAMILTLILSARSALAAGQMDQIGAGIANNPSTILKSFGGSSAGEYIRDFNQELLSVMQANAGARLLVPEELRNGYDLGRGMHKFTFANGRSFYSSILPGMTTSGTARFEFDEGLTLTNYYYKDDVMMEYVPGQTFSQHGTYRIIIHSPHNDAGETGKRGFTTVFSFRIIRHRVNNLSVINAPLSCQIMSVYTIYQGTSHSEQIYNTDFFRIYCDGKYKVKIKDLRTNIEYIDDFEVDNTPPILQFTGLDKKGVSYSDVNIKVKAREDFEDDKVSVHVTRSGETLGIMGRSQTFSQPGFYNIIATDIAGNVYETSFKIIYALHIPWQLGFIIFVLVGGAVMWEILYLRRKIEIR
jgi:hypothetical protein